ncbi:MAG TPA: hypothetical protein DFR83_05545 [Deltaproteobacteria bacterium]|nr:hypothetical protein [Deltaproteobacteria bacterium]
MFRAMLLLASLSVATEPDIHPAEAAVLEALEAKDPEMAEKMLALRATDPGIYQKKLRHFADTHRRDVHEAHLRRDPELRKAEAALHRVEAQLKPLFMAHQAAESEQARTEIESELQALAHTLFARKAALKRMHLDQQQAHLDAIRADFDAWEADLELEAETWLDIKLQALEKP